MKVGFASDLGKVRETNEDNLYVDKEVGLFIVADGMGGHRAGEVASEMAVRVISSVIKEKVSEADKKNIFSVIKKSISIANDEIYRKSRENPNLNGMGTTTVLALLNKNKFYIGNIGDSRAYLIRNSKITQLTEDHSLVADLVKTGQITKEEARVHPRRNVITRALGTREDIKADIKSINIKEGDYILLCTDGLTDMLRDEEIRDIILSPKNSIQGKCRELINKANEKGGRDNITVVLILFEKRYELYNT